MGSRNFIYLFFLIFFFWGGISIENKLKKVTTSMSKYVRHSYSPPSESNRVVRSQLFEIITKLIDYSYDIRMVQW